ncbi:MAG TPA: AbrB/MazE/SpoVT family DNA-binding domain-containing protein [Spirochaetota bacterium]|nr:AbrB/MazE/SpoVT family DNA-binding domain-containing protein [Spirochaetota bacterium]
MAQDSGKGEQHIYGVVKVSPKGQVIIPADLRAELNIKPGEQLVATRSRDGKGVLLLKMNALRILCS